MRSYSALKLFLLLCIATYFTIGLLTEIFGKQEIIPIYSWFLFITVPNEKVEYAVLLYEYHGKVFQPPIFFQEAKGIVNQPTSAVALSNIQDFGRAESAGNKEESERVRKLFEQNFLPPPARYELVRLRYDPVQRWRKGEIKEFKHIREFRTWEQDN